MANSHISEGPDNIEKYFWTPCTNNWHVTASRNLVSNFQVSKHQVQSNWWQNVSQSIVSCLVEHWSLFAAASLRYQLQQCMARAIPCPKFKPTLSRSGNILQRTATKERFNFILFSESLLCSSYTLSSFRFQCSCRPKAWPKQTFARDCRSPGPSLLASLFRTHCLITHQHSAHSLCTINWPHIFSQITYALSHLNSCHIGMHLTSCLTTITLGEKHAQRGLELM